MYKISIRYDLQPSRKEIREAIAEAMQKEMLHGMKGSSGA